MNAWLAIFIGGGVGSVLRFAVSRVLLLVQTKPPFPWLCGGFSTMSTFSYENYLLIRNGLFGFAMINVLLTVTLGIMLFYFFARTP